MLKWSNPVAGNIYGNVFLWTHEKRPMAVGSFYKWFSPWTHSTHEFHSLATQPLNARFNDRSVWKPVSAGVKWQTLPDVPKPARAAPSRLLQMRSFSRQFSVEKTDKDEVRRMRLLSQPVYRYASPKNGVVDGALFVFVQGTDPEVWLLIEAEDSNPTKSEKEPSIGITQWRYAVARMNATQFTIKRNGQTIRDIPKVEWKSLNSADGGYFKINAAELPTGTSEIRQFDGEESLSGANGSVLSCFGSGATENFPRALPGAALG